MLNLSNKLGLNNSKNPQSAAGFENLYSLDFDGVDDYVTIPNNAAYTPTAVSGWSISYWCKVPSANKKLIGKYQNPNYEWYLQSAKTTGYQSIQFHSGNNQGLWQKLAANIDIADDNWHHVINTFDSSNQPSSIISYIDGIKYSAALGNATWTSSGTWTGVTNTAAPLDFGAFSQTSFTDCNLDEVSIFDSVLSDATALAMYNSGTPTDLTGETNLQGWWRNGDTAGTSVYPTIEDYSSNSNDGTMTNMDSGDIVTVVP